MRRRRRRRQLPAILTKPMRFKYIWNEEVGDYFIADEDDAQRQYFERIEAVCHDLALVGDRSDFGPDRLTPEMLDDPRFQKSLLYALLHALYPAAFWPRRRGRPSQHLKRAGLYKFVEKHKGELGVRGAAAAFAKKTRGLTAESARRQYYLLERNKPTRPV